MYFFKFVSFQFTVILNLYIILVRKFLCVYSTQDHYSISKVRCCATQYCATQSLLLAQLISGRHLQYSTCCITSVGVASSVSTTSGSASAPRSSRAASARHVWSASARSPLSISEQLMRSTLPSWLERGLPRLPRLPPSLRSAPSMSMCTCAGHMS